MRGQREPRLGADAISRAVVATLLTLLFASALAGSAQAAPTASLSVWCADASDPFWCPAPIVNSTTGGAFAPVDTSAVFAYPFDEGCYCGTNPIVDIHPDNVTYPNRNLTRGQAAIGGRNILDLFPASYENGTGSFSGCCTTASNNVTSFSVGFDDGNATRGSRSIRLEGARNGTAADSYVGYRINIGGLGAVPAGTPFTTSADARRLSGSDGNLRIVHCWTNATDEWISCAGTHFNSTDDWTRSSHTTTKPPNVTGLRVFIREQFWTESGTGVLLVDGVQLEIGSTASPFSWRVPWVAGHSGTALEFDGHDDAISIADDASLDQADYTIAYRAKTAFPLPRNGTPLAREGQVRLDHNTTGWMPRVHAGGTDWTLTDADGTIPLPTDGQWHHYALAFDGAACAATAYIDGRAVAWANLTAPCGYGNATAPVVLGEGFRGMLDDVRYHARAFSAAEIAALAHPGATCELDGVPVTCGSFPVTGDGPHRVFLNVTNGGSTATASVALGVDSLAPVASVRALCPLPGDAGWCRSPFFAPRFFYNDSGATVYEEDFTSPPGSEWSLQEHTSAAGNGLLGDFGPGGVHLSLTDLPPHEHLTIEYDLYIQRSWDGTNAPLGPDVFNLSVVGGPTLLNTTFSNRAIGSVQCYPSSCPAAHQGGKSANGVPYQAPSRDVYRISHTFPHTASDVTFRFFSGQNQAESDESWALDDVRVLRDVSGLAPMSRACKSNETAVVDCFQNVTKQGATTLYGNVSDRAGNTAFAWGTTKLDSIAPAITADLGFTGLGVGGAYTIPPKVKLTSSDATSGLAGPLDYRIDNGTWTTYTSPFVLGEGTWWLQAIQRDVAGNVGTLARQVKVDLTHPTIAIEPAGVNASGWFAPDVSITLAASEPMSRLVYRVDNGTPTIYGGPFTLTSAGAHTIEAWGEDAAGNPHLPDASSTPAAQVAAGTFATCVLNATGSADCFGWNESGRAADPPGATITQLALGAQHTCGLHVNGSVTCWGSAAGNRTAGYSGGDATWLGAGWDHSCVVTEPKNVVCWGVDAAGDTAPYNGGDAVAVAAGQESTCVLRTNGNVTCWGNSAFGRLAGYSGGNATALAGGGRGHHCVLTVDGNVDCWGLNNWGQSADYFAGDATAVATGGDHTCVLRTSGNVTCWGRNDYRHSEPYLGGDAVAIAAGLHHTCAVLTSGRVECWGLDDGGQGSDWSPSLHAPIAIDATAPQTDAALSGTAGDAGWFTSNVTATLAATDAEAGVATIFYRLDNGTTQTYASPVPLATSSYLEYLAVDAVGNAEMVRGTMVRIDSDAPTLMMALGTSKTPATLIVSASDAISGLASTEYRVDNGTWQSYTTPFPLAEGAWWVEARATDVAGNVQLVAQRVVVDLTHPTINIALPDGSGDWHATGNVVLTPSEPMARLMYRLDGGAETAYAGPIAIGTSGNHTIEAWGEDLAGNPSEANGASVAVAQVTAGSASTCVLNATGTVDCYGRNDPLTFEDRTAGDVAQVSIGDEHSCYLLTSGNVDCFGTNWGGRTNDYHGGDAVAVTSGGNHNCVLRTNANVTCWGGNGFGQAAPYNGGDAAAIAAGYYTTCILRVNGTVFCQGMAWGGGAGGYAGNDGIAVGGGGSHHCVLTSGGNVDCWGQNGSGQAADDYSGDAIAIALGGSHTCALRQGGNVTCWGANGAGQSAAYTGGDAVAIAARGGHTCALLAAGRVECWGNNPDGQAADWAPAARATFAVETTPPVTTLTLAGTQGSGAWFTSNVTATLEAVDAQAGVGSIFYRLDGGAEQTYAEPIVLASSTDIRYWAVDALGNVEPARDATVLIDDEGPSVSPILDGTPGENGYWRSAVDVTLEASDEGSGVARIEYLLSGSAWQTYAEPIRVDASATLLARAVDGAGNVGADLLVEILVDVEPPTSTATPAGPLGEAGYYTGAVDVTLAASDAVSETTVFFQLDGGPTQEYRQPVVVSGEGAHLLRYRARDAAGNEEAWQDLPLQIDSVAPHTNASLLGPEGANGWHLDDVTVTLSASDATSGPAGISYRLDGGAWQQYEGAFVITSTAGLEARASDLAGNEEAAQSFNVSIDRDAPLTSLAESCEVERHNGWCPGVVTVVASASDDASGIASTLCDLDGAAFDCGAPLDAGEDGDHVATITATDVAGRVASASVGFRVDRTAPLVSLLVEGTAGEDGWILDDARVTVAHSDATSSSHARLQVDNGTVAENVTTIDFSTDGVRFVQAWAQDDAGNLAPVVSLLVKVDKTDPHSELLVPEPDGEALWHRTPPTLDIAADDGSGAGVAGLMRRLDNGTDVAHDGPFLLEASGHRWVEWWAADHAGRVAAPQQREVRVDAVAPEVGFATTCDAPGERGWCRSPFTFAPLPADEHSGLATATCALDGASIPCDERSVEEQGHHNATLTASDVAGNDASATLPFRIDRVPPSASVAVACEIPTINGICRGNLTFTPSFADSVSGVHDASCTLDEEAVACASTRVTSEGEHTFRLVVTDGAGHVSDGSARGIIDKVAPTVQILVSCARAGADGWCLEPAGATFVAEEAGAPAHAATCSRNGTALPSCEPLSLGEGTTRLAITASDAAGNTASTTATVTVDMTAPSASITPSCATPGSPGWCRSGSFSYSGASTDGASGVPPGRPTCSADGLASPSCSGVLSGQGMHRVDLQTQDRAGWRNNATLLLGIDTVAPTAQATVSCSAALVAGWCPTFVSVESGASDGTSGVAGWTCRLDGAPAECADWQVALDGHHNATTTATDNAGNVGSQTTAFRIDATPPVAAVDAVCSAPLAGGWCPSEVTLATSADDATSGVRSTSCRVDGENFPCGGAITASGLHVAQLEAQDNAGHVSTSAVGFRIDASPPLAWANATCPQEGGSSYCLAEVDVSGEGSDEHAGVASVACFLDDAPSPCSLTIGDDGVRAFRVDVTDLAGNVRSETVIVRTDLAGPLVDVSVECSAPRAAGWCPGIETATTTAADEGSGLADTTCRLDDTVVACGTIETGAQGGHVVEIVATDASGRSSRADASFRIDSVAPAALLSSSCSLPGEAGWCRGVASFIGEGSDATSGVASLTCLLDGLAAPCAGFATGQEGPHDASVAAVDEAGNAATASASVLVDTRPPSVSIDTTCSLPGDNGWCRGVVSALATASDEGSGVLLRTCRIDGALASCDALTITKQGHHNVTIEARDVAGNTATAAVGVRIDTGAPFLDPRIVCAVRSKVDWCRAPSFTYDALVTETVSGVAVGPVCHVDDAPDADCRETLSGERTHRLRLDARDEAGNENTLHLNVTIDSSTPTLASATAGPKAGEVTLSWSAPSGASAASGYRIHHATRPGGPFTPATLVGDVLSGTDRGLAAGTTYYFRVTAFSDEAGESAPSDVMSATTFALPSAPVNLTASGGSGRVIITWEPPASDGGAPITSYRVFRGTFENSTRLRAEVDGSTFRLNEPAADPAETPTGRVFYRILAVNAAGAGAFTQEVEFRTAGGVAAPGQLQRTEERPTPEEAGSSAVPFNETWRRFGFAGQGQDDAPRVMAAHPAGTIVYVAGTRRVGDDHDYATVAYDAVTGAELWSAVHARPGFDRPTGIAVDPFGQRVYVSGQADGDYLTVAYDARTGQLIWLHQFGAPELVEGATGVTATHDGILVLVTGQTSGGGTRGDVTTFALDAVDGKPLWSAPFATPADDRAVAVLADRNGRRLFVVGTSGDDMVATGYDMLTGAPIWLKRYDNGGKDLAVGAALSRDGERLYATGTSAGPDGTDYATLAYNTTTGAVLWTARLDGQSGGGRSDDAAAAMTLSSDGLRLFVTGRSGAADGSGSDVTTVAYQTTTGVEIWRNRVDVSLDDDASGIALAPDDVRLYVVGRSWNGTHHDMRIVFHDAATGAAVLNHTFVFGGPRHDAAVAVLAAPGPDRNVHVHVAGEWGRVEGSAFALISYAPAVSSPDDEGGDAQAAMALPAPDALLEDAAGAAGDIAVAVPPDAPAAPVDEPKTPLPEDATAIVPPTS